MDEQTPSSTTTPGASGEGIYLYCFARPGLPRGEKGVRPLLPVGPKGACAQKGSDPFFSPENPVTLVEVGDVAAVCTHVTLDDFTGESGELHFQDPAWVVPRACRHEQVIEEVMTFSPVFPVRFGAVFSSREALAQMIADRGAEISSFLDRVVGKEEWCVKGFVDIDKAADRLLETDPALAEQYRSLPESPGARYFQQKRLRAEALKKAKHSCRSTADQVDHELAGLTKETGDAPLNEGRPESGEVPAEGSVPCPLKLGDAPDGKGEMVLKRAFLLFCESVDEFRDRVAEIGDRHADSGVTLELSGPWPPYSFCPR